MKLKITVNGVAYEVDVEVLDAGEGFPAASPLPAVQSAPRAAAAAALPPADEPVAATGGSGKVASPLAGVVLEVLCKAGDPVTQGQKLIVIEAMKMKTNVTAPAAGQIKEVAVEMGDSVREGQVLVEMG